MVKATDNNVNCTSVYGCRGCYGCDGCDGCYRCHGCNYSFGLRDCKAVYKSIFCKGLFGERYKLFNKVITESRFEEVLSNVQSFNFYPKQTNAFELCTKNGNEWSKIDTSKLGTKDWNDSWESCPKEMISYLKSLPEFDAAIFEEITGIKIEDNSEAKQKAAELRKKADELLASAKELESSL